MCNAWLELVCEYAQQTRKSCTWWHILGHEVSFSLPHSYASMKADLRCTEMRRYRIRWQLKGCPVKFVTCGFVCQIEKYEIGLHSARRRRLNSLEGGRRPPLHPVHSHEIQFVASPTSLYYWNSTYSWQKTSLADRSPYLSIACTTYMQSSLRSPNSFHARSILSGSRVESSQNNSLEEDEHIFIFLSDRSDNRRRRSHLCMLMWWPGCQVHNGGRRR